MTPLRNFRSPVVALDWHRSACCPATHSSPAADGHTTNPPRRQRLFRPSDPIPWYRIVRSNTELLPCRVRARRCEDEASCCVRPSSTDHSETVLTRSAERVRVAIAFAATRFAATVLRAALRLYRAGLLVPADLRRALHLSQRLRRLGARLWPGRGRTLPNRSASKHDTN
jgi:hypothetical protein